MAGMIRAARLRRGWTQDELAARLGIKASYISQWETGIRKWPGTYVRALAEALGLSQVEMAVAAGLIDRPDTAPPPAADPAREAVYAVAAEMTPEEVALFADVGRDIVRHRLNRHLARPGRDPMLAGA